MSWTGASKVGEDDCEDGQVTSYAEYDPSGKSPGDEDTVSVSYCGKSDEITVEIGASASGSLTGGGACPGQNVAITAKVYNSMGCDETFTWEVRKKADPEGGEANVTFMPESGSTGTLAAGSWSDPIPITVTVDQGSALGTAANIELIAKVGNVEATNPDNRPEAGIGVPAQAAFGFIDDAGGCPGQEIQIPCLITNTGFCDDSFQWKIIKLVGALSFTEVSGTTVQLMPAFSDATPVDYTIPSSAEPGQSATVELQIKLNGTWEPKDTAVISAACPTVTFTSKDPPVISADSNWPEMPHAYATSIITVQWDPPECVGDLEIVEILDMDEGGYNPGDGTLTKISDTQWKYMAFQEPQGEKHPHLMRVTIGAKIGNTICQTTNLSVQTIHRWWHTPHQHGPGAGSHEPDSDDFWNNFKYIKWKYGATLDIINPGFNNFVIDEDDCVGCLFGCNYACTFWGTITFGRSMFTGTENQAASIIGHELKHTVGDGSECSSYTWEWDNQLNTGIDQDQQYLDDVERKMGEECP